MAMVRIATDPKASLELRGRMNAELAQYVYPKRKSVEVAGDEANPLGFKKIEIVFVKPAMPAPSDFGGS